MAAKKRIFGPDGVRGTANVEPVTAETALKLGRAAAHVFKHLESQPRGRGRHKIVMGNAGLDAVIEHAGGQVVRTPVGDKHVIDEMLRHGCNFGGEQSGHLIFGDHSTAGDGLVSALQILRIMRNQGQPLSKLAQCWTRFQQVVTHIVVREKIPFEELDGIMARLAQAEAKLKPDGGWVLLRYSGTEPKARLLLEGRDAAALKYWSGQIGDAIKRQVGA